jgi:cysteine desulfurase/selenocysteine lyase
MSTTGNSGPAGSAVEPPVPDLAHSDLVTKLVAEAFSGFSRLSKTPAALAPEIPGLPGTPSSVAPVHPPAPPAGPGKTPSGAHSPESGDSYAFGEPRCNGSYRPQGNRPDTKIASTNPLPGLPEAESPAGPEYYFLRGGNAVGKSPVTRESCSSSRPVPVPGFDIEGVRRDFPALQQLVNGRPLIWLDNAATTHKPQTVIDETSRFYSRDNSNIHRAAHTLAARSTELFEAGREKVRRFLGAADAKEIVFVRGTTEAINLVAQSYGRKNIGAGDEIIVSELEHHANIVPWQLLAEQVGATLRVIPINDRGELILDEYVKLLGPRTKFVSVAHVSNALGTVNAVEQIIALAHARGVPVLVDGAQSTPHLPVNVTALDADFYVFSGHKVFAPTGIGALYGKAPLLEAMPPWQGGGHMIKDVRFEKTTYQNAPEKFEAGTPDIAGVAGLGAAIDYLFKVGIPGIAAYEHALLEYAIQALEKVPGIRLIGTAANKASVFSFVLPGISNDAIAKHLDKNGIAVRAGHHCALPAVRHFGLESSVRPSLAFYNTREEVDALVRAVRALKRH